jgi:hypothetical protein
MPTKLVRLIKMRLNRTCTKLRMVKSLSGTVPIQNGLKQADTLPLLPLPVRFRIWIRAKKTGGI